MPETTIEAPAVASREGWLRAGVKATEIGVDRENKRILGFVLAQEGPFRESEPRGEFDQKSLKKIVTLARAKRGGLKSRFAHPSLSGDGIGTFLGRVHNVRLDTVTVERPEGIVALMAVRGDLHFAESAFNSPNGNLAGYVMDLAEEDSDAVSSSLVLQPEEEWRLDANGRPLVGEDGRELPPLWRPLALHASDIVDEGAAVDGLLSAGVDVDGLHDAQVRRACELLSGFLPDAARDVVEARLQAFLSRALDWRFGAVEESESEPPKMTSDDAARRLKARKLEVA